MPVPILRDYQEEAVGRLRAAYRSHRTALFVLPTGGGKCLGKGTSVMMFDGSIKAVEDVVVGDVLMGPDSLPRRVIKTCRGKDTMYRVTPNKAGDSFICNSQHVLSLKRTRERQTPRYPCQTRAGEIVNISVVDYLSKSDSFKHLHKLWRSPSITFGGSRRRLPISPYALGLWLGDGSSRTASLTTMDPESVMAWREEANRFGLFLRSDQKPGNRSQTFHMSGLRMVGGTVANGFLSAIRALGVFENKHIPGIYKTSTIADRLDLLAGIIDTDGSSNKSGFDLTFKSKVIAEDTVFICRSLGLSASIRSCRKKCHNNGKIGTYYRIAINGECDRVPVRIARKVPARRVINKDCLVTGFKIDQLGYDEYFGFELEGPDRLFLLGDFTVSHNSIVGAYIVQNAVAKGKRVHWYVHRKELVRQISDTFDQFGIEHGFILAGSKLTSKPVQIGMYQTVANRLHLIPEPDFIVIDECVCGDSIIQTNIGDVKIKDVPKSKPSHVKTVENGAVVYKKILGWKSSGIRECLRITTSTGDSVICTPDHLVFCEGKWLKAESLKKGSRVVGFTRLVEIAKISRCGARHVYDIEVEGTHCFFANGVLVHNCHRARGKTYVEILKYYRKAHHLGLTATPQRTDGQGLGDVFETMVVGPSMKHLIGIGALAKYRLFVPPQMYDLEGVRIVGGDYQAADLEKRMDRPVVTGDAISHFKKSGMQRAIGFCVSLDHTKSVAADFRRAGIRAETIDGTMSDDERVNRLDALRRGDIRLLNSAQLISEGVDIPAVDGIVDLCPSQSVIKVMQGWGRALRPAPGKIAIILDHAGNIRHGRPCAERDWSLEGREKGKRAPKVDGLKIRQCRQCYCVFEVTDSSCPNCGAVPEAIRKIEIREGTLVEVTEEMEREGWFKTALHAEALGACKSIDDLKFMAKTKGYKPQWVIRQVCFREDCSPFVAAMKCGYPRNLAFYMKDPRKQSDKKDEEKAA